MRPGVRLRLHRRRVALAPDPQLPGSAPATRAAALPSVRRPPVPSSREDVECAAVSGGRSRCCTPTETSPSRGAERSIERRALVRRAVMGDFDHDRRDGPCRSRAAASCACSPRSPRKMRADAAALRTRRSRLPAFPLSAGSAWRRAPAARRGARRARRACPVIPAKPCVDRRARGAQHGDDALVVCAPVRLADDDVLAREATADTPPTWSASKWVRSRKSSWVMPRRSTHAVGGFRCRPTSIMRDRVPVAHEQAVALADVARGDLPIGRDRRAPPERSPAEACRRRRPTPARSAPAATATRMPPSAAHRLRQREHEDGDQDRSGADITPSGPVEPGQSCCAGRRARRLGHLRDPCGRHPGEPDQGLSERRAPRGAARHARRPRIVPGRRGGLGKQVRQHAVQRQASARA